MFYCYCNTYAFFVPRETRRGQAQGHGLSGCYPFNPFKQSAARFIGI